MRSDETKNTTSTNKVRFLKEFKSCTYMIFPSFKVYPRADLTVIKPEFQQTKSLDFETKGLTAHHLVFLKLFSLEAH